MNHDHADKPEWDSDILDRMSPVVRAQHLYIRRLVERAIGLGAIPAGREAEYAERISREIARHGLSMLGIGYRIGVVDGGGDDGGNILDVIGPGEG